MTHISRSESNQTMKFGQLIECNMRNIFLEKSYSKYGGQTSPRYFLKKLKLSIYPNQQSKVLHSLFLLYVKVEGYKTILKLRSKPFALTSYKAFFKNKNRFENSPPASLSA